MAEVTKKKRISKKNKAAWRKTDIRDVEDFLEEQRQEERIGKFSEKKDEDLFTIDATPSKPKRVQLTEKQKRKLNAQKPLRSLEALVNTSKVTDPIVKRNTVKQKKNGRLIEDEVRNPTRPRHFQANKDRQVYYKRLEEKLAPKSKDSTATAHDIWAEEDFRDKIPGLKDEKGWISRDLALHVAKNVGKAVIKVHDSLRHRTTKAKTFEPPHPGMSYNPALEDHQALIGQVVEREQKIIKTEKHLKRVTTDMYNKVTPEEREEQRLKEMRSGLDEDEDQEAQENITDEEEDNEMPYTTVNPPVENKKKSKQARNKELRQKELQKRKESKQALKKQIVDLNRIKSLKAEVVAEEEELNALKKHRKKVAFKKKFEPKRISRVKFEEPEIDVNMAEDIAGNLRNVKVESSLAVDRLKNFQKRNMLPAGVAMGKRQTKKVKRFARSTHKDPGVSFQMLRERRKALMKAK